MDEREKRVKLEKLTSLEEKYIQVMYYRFLDKPVSEIQRILDIPNEKTVWRQFTRIYEVLGITGNDKEGELIREYSPLFFDFFKSEDDLKNWGYIRAQMLREISSLSPPLPDLMSDPVGLSSPPPSDAGSPEIPDIPDPTAKSSQAPEVTRSDQTNEERRTSNRPPWIVIGVSALVACLICISGGLFLWRNRPQPTASPTVQIPLSTETAVATNTMPVVASETSLPLSTDTAIPPTPSSLPTDTPPPTESPTPSVQALFNDDFNNGKSQSWQVLYGSEPVIVNGALNFNDMTECVNDLRQLE